VARDWTPAQLFTRLVAMILPPAQRAKLIQVETRVAAKTSFGKRPSPTHASASQRKKGSPQMQIALPWWTYSVVAYVAFIAVFMALLVWGVAG
jgi:hypothetical protein